ncbi:AAA family ATPase [Nocardioides sp. NPDC057577]|uniref:AAA family ATPase n=1 Tax=Nocardioides sp. NPDC057577 TaxID=3346171 RepID=UPI0036709015
MASNPAETAIRIVLARSEAQIPRPDGQLVLAAVADGGTWNDFSKNFNAHLHFVGFEEEYAPLAMKLMFADELRTDTKVQTLLRDRGHVNIEILDEIFVSALADLTSYKTIVERIGFGNAFASLRSLHDIVVTRLEGVDSPTIGLAETVNFTEGVLRNADTWVAVRQGARYLSPILSHDVEDSAQSFEVRASLAGMPGDHVLDADFGVDFPLSRRSLVLVGENGVGKTRLFQALIEGLQERQTWDGDAASDDTATFDPKPIFSRLVVFSSAASDSYPSQLPPWRGVDYRFHRMAGGPATGADTLAQSFIDCVRMDAADEDLAGMKRVDLLDEVLEPLGVKSHLHVEVKDDPDEEAPHLPTPTVHNGSRYLPFFSISGEQRRLRLQARMISNAEPKVIDASGRVRDLSSGEQALVRFAVQAAGSVRPGSLLLFDEPETHLHPRYVSQFMSMLDRLLGSASSVALIASHSAYVVREVPARRVRIIRTTNPSEVTIEPPGLQTFGASIDTISQFVFGDLALKHRYQSLLDQWMESTLDPSVEAFRQRFQDDLNAETLSYLAQILSERREE